MSEQGAGPDWWQASDGKWYPPEQRPTSAPTPKPEPSQAQSGFASGLGPTSWVVLGGIGAGLIGSFLPWASAGPFTVNGTDGDGGITLIASIAAGGCYAYHLQERAARKGTRIAALALMVITALIYVIDFVDISTLVDNELLDVSPGFGIVLGTIGSIVAVSVLIFEMVKYRTSASLPE